MTERIEQSAARIQRDAKKEAGIAYPRDICLASIIAVMRIFKIEVHGIPTVMRVMAACEQLDAFAAADPSRQVGAPQA